MLAVQIFITKRQKHAKLLHALLAVTISDAHGQAHVSKTVATTIIHTTKPRNDVTNVLLTAIFAPRQIRVNSIGVMVALLIIKQHNPVTLALLVVLLANFQTLVMLMDARTALCMMWPTILAELVLRTATFAFILALVRNKVALMDIY